VTTVPVLIPPDSDDLGHVLAIIILASRWPAHLLLAIAEAHWSSSAGRAGVPGAHVKIASGPRLSCGPPARGLAPPPGLESMPLRGPSPAASRPEAAGERPATEVAADLGRRRSAHHLQAGPFTGQRVRADLAAVPGQRTWPGCLRSASGTTKACA